MLSDDEEGSALKAKKRTSITLSSSKPPSETKVAKLRNGAIMSDDEDEDEPVKVMKSSRKGKRRAVASDDEGEAPPSLKAMMDLDDCK